MRKVVVHLVRDTPGTEFGTSRRFTSRLWFRTRCHSGTAQPRTLLDVEQNNRATEKAVSEDRASEVTHPLPEQPHEAAVRLLSKDRRIDQKSVGYRHFTRATTR